MIELYLGPIGHSTTIHHTMHRVVFSLKQNNFYTFHKKYYVYPFGPYPPNQTNVLRSYLEFFYTPTATNAPNYTTKQTKTTKNYSKDSKKRSRNDKRETVNEIETSHFKAM